MDETYRMLGREHDSDLEREADRRRLAAAARASGSRHRRGPSSFVRAVAATRHLAAVVLATSRRLSCLVLLLGAVAATQLP